MNSFSRLWLILVACCANFSVSLISSAQIPWNEGLGVKYAYYKARLYDTLMLSATRFSELDIPPNLNASNFHLVTNFGYDIPASNRELPDCMFGGQICEDINKSRPVGYHYHNNIKFGDATSYLGQLIAALALEYELRRRSNQETETVKFEIWKLLETYRRLDIYAEYFWSTGENCTPPNTVNGFFLRDDVEPRVYSQNMFAKQAEGTFHAPCVSTSIASDFLMDATGGHLAQTIIDQTWGVRTGRYSMDNIANIPSRDQISYLLMGFAFVAKFFHNTNETVYDKYGNVRQYNYHLVAKEFTNAIMTRLYFQDYKMSMPCSGERIRHFYVDEGGMLTSYGMQQAGRILMGSGYNAYSTISSHFHYSLWQFQANFDAIELLMKGIDVKVNRFNRAFVQTLAALGNSWHNPTGLGNIIGHVLLRAGIKIKNFPKQNTMDPLNRLGIRWNNPYFAYIHADLHNGHGRLSNQIRQTAFLYLATASCHTFDRYPRPKINQSDPIEYREYPPYNTDNLMIYSYRMLGEEQNGSIGKFNGVDFMLLHNLFLYDEVVRNQSTYLASTGYRNYYQHLFQENKPNYNSPQPQYNYHSVHDMFVKNSSVGNNNTLFFRADDEIIVSETDFQPGSYVVLESKPYDCGGIFGAEVYKQMDYSEELDSVKADMARYDSVLAFWDDVRAQVNNDSLFTQLMIQAYQESYNQQLAELEGGPEATEQPFDLSVYPSPTRDKVNITLPPYAGSLKVQDALGRTHVTQTFSPTEGEGQITHTLDLKQLGLSNGLYFVCFTTTHQQGCARFVYQP